MNTHLQNFSSLTALALLFTAIPLYSEEAASIPQGVIQYSMAATGAGQTLTAHFSIPVREEPVYSGTVQTVGSNTITVANTPFTSGALSASNAPHFVSFTSGAQAGRSILITANTNNTLTVDTTDNSSQTVALTTSGFAVQAGDTFEIFPTDTLASLFGDNTGGNPLVLVGGTAFSADSVTIYNPILSRNETFYFNTSRNAWNSGTGTINQNNKILYPEGGFSIVRRANRPALSFYVIGTTPAVAPITKTTGSSSLQYTSTRFPIDMTLAQLNLTNWTKSNSAFTADSLKIWNPTLSRWEAYYQVTDSTWRKSGNTTTDVSSQVIPAGSMVQLLKRSAVSNATSYIAANIPYSLN